MRRLLLWLLVPAMPLTVVLGLLALQDPPQPPRAIAPVEMLPAAELPPAARAWTFALKHADGEPAGDGVVIVIEPEVATAAVSSAGICTLTARAAGPVSVLAWAPGHRVRAAGPWDSPPLELRLDAMETPPELEPPLRLASLNVRLTEPDGAPLAGALLLARPASRPDAPPWLAFADADGRAVCETEATRLALEVYAPGRAPRAPWLLASIEREADAQEWNWEIASARLELAGLAAMEPVELRRGGETLDLLAVGEDGVARWSALAPGAWELATAAGRMRLVLEPGTRRVQWAPEAAP